MGIAENIKLRRLEMGLSQQELADLMGYKSRSTITRIESGENEAPEAKLPKFARALDTSVEFLRTGEKVKKPVLEYRGDGGEITAVILAGGKSTRNMQNIPNQFINVLGKPVIIYVLEAYQRHPSVNQIYVVCLKNWEDIVFAYAKQYGITKLAGIISAGETGVLSVRNAVEFLLDRCHPNSKIVFQESTRPLVTEEIISKLLRYDDKVIICESMSDFVQMLEEGGKKKYVDRDKLYALQSPEMYRLSTLKEVFRHANTADHHFKETTCAMLFHNLGYDLQLCEGNHNNIKVVRQEDIAILSALLKNRS